MRPAPMTTKVQAIVYEGASPEPDPLDNLRAEFDAALWQHEIAVAQPLRLRLSLYARKCESMLAKPIDPAAESSFDGIQLQGEHGPITVTTRPRGIYPPAGTPCGTSDVIDYGFRLGDQHGSVAFDGRLVRLLGDKGRQAWDIMAREVGEMLGRFRAEPALEVLARALWETDPEVRSFAVRTSECYAPGTNRKVGSERWLRVLDTAWERREPAGSRERAEERAAAVLVVLGGRS